MGQAIGIRLSKDILRNIEDLSKEEMEDRSTMIRKLVIMGYQDFMKKKCVLDYKKGKITFSEAAHRAGLTLWEMENYLIEQGVTSNYSVEELEKEMKLLK